MEYGGILLLNDYKYNDRGTEKHIEPFPASITSLKLEKADGSSQDIKIDAVLSLKEIPKQLLYPNTNPVSIVVFCVAAWKLWGYYNNYHGGRKEYEQLRQYVKEKKDSDKKKKKKSGPDTCPVQVDFDALARINPDVKAWIYIKGTGINYPIVQTTDNTSYLHRTFEGKDSFIGAIFLDAGCEADFSSENSIVYGHNLKNGQMFGMLKKHYDTSYNADADYKDHQKIWIITPQEEIEYQVFAAREIDVNVDVDVYTIEFATEEDYADYLKTAVEKALYHL